MYLFNFKSNFGEIITKELNNMFLSNRLSYQVIKSDSTVIIAQLQIIF